MTPKPNPGDKVNIKAKDKLYQGILMERPKLADDKHLIIKLKSGYNVGLNKEEIKEIKVVEKRKEKEKKKEKKEIKKDPKKPTISILHTGGTIASKVDYRTGAVYSAFSPQELLELFPELGEIANFNSRLIANMWSDDLRFKHFQVIAEAVQEEVKKGAEGIIIGMGTDNLAVASAALAFILEKLPVPALLVGAQRSSDRGSSDTAMNLICAAEFITKTDFSGVALCIHESMSDKNCVILPPCKTRKLHSSRRDAFKPVNDKPIARINYRNKKIKFFKENYSKKELQRKLVLKPNMEEKVALLKMRVNMFPEEFEFYEKNNFKGLVIEGTGLGHAPGHVPDKHTKIHSKIFPILKRMINKGCVVVMTTQCLFGRVNMNVYSKGKDLQEIGVIPGEDMLPETAYVKLAWLLGNYSPEKVKKLVRKNLRGEISQRSEIEENVVPNFK